MPKIVSQEDLQKSIDYVTKHGVKKASAKLGIPESTLRSRYQSALNKGMNSVETNAPDSAEKYVKSESDNKASIDSVSTSVKTVEDALAKGEIDLDVWYVTKSVVNSWEVGIKRLDGSVKVQPLWQVKVWLERKVQKVFSDAMEALIKRMDKHSPKYQKITRSIPKTNKHLLEISLFDVHFGKLAWEMETNQNYDIKIAEKLYHDAIEDLLVKSSGYPISRILMPVGQDFFHIDNPTKTTINGTPQDVDSRYTKLFEIGVMACVKAIDKLLTVAPVEIVYVPGNHDRTASWHLVSNLRSWYRTISDVSVDASPTLRKYVKYGINLLGFTHGDEEPHRDLPSIMATEVPQMWADTVYREWHLGHFHKKKEITYVNCDTYGSTMIRMLPSLSATDAWHYMKGYVASRRAAECYLWSETDGYSGHFSSNVR